MGPASWGYAGRGFPGALSTEWQWEISLRPHGSAPASGSGSRSWARKRAKRFGSALRLSCLRCSINTCWPTHPSGPTAWSPTHSPPFSWASQPHFNFPHQGGSWYWTVWSVKIRQEDHWSLNCLQGRVTQTQPMSRCPVHLDDSFIEGIQAWVTQTSKSAQQIVTSSLFLANLLFGAASALVSKKQGDGSSAGSGLPTAPGGPQGLAAPWSAGIALYQEQSSPSGIPAPLRPALHFPDRTLTPSLGRLVI